MTLNGTQGTFAVAGVNIAGGTLQLDGAESLTIIETIGTLMRRIQILAQAFEVVGVDQVDSRVIERGPYLLMVGRRPKSNAAALAMRLVQDLFQFL